MARGILGVVAVTFIAFASLFVPTQLSQLIFGSSFESYNLPLNVKIFAVVLDGTITKTVNITIGNKTVEISKTTVVVDSYLYFSIKSNSSQPVYLTYVGVRAFGLLSEDVPIAPFGELSGYLKIPFNVTWQWCGVWFTVKDMKGNPYPFYVLAPVEDVSNSTFSQIIGAMASAVLIGDFKGFPVKVKIENGSANIMKVRLTTNESFLDYYIINTGPTTVNLTSITLQGVELLEKPITIQPWEAVSGTISIPTIINQTVIIPPINITFEQNYTATFTFIAFKKINATATVILAEETTTENVTAY